MKTGILLKVMVSVFIVMGFFSSGALGQTEFPTEPVNVYIGFAPGGGATHSGTIITDGMKRYLGTPVTMNFKPGAAQAIAAEFIANSKPDGYNLFWTAPADLIAKVTMDPSKVKFKFEDLDPIGSACYTPFVMVVNAESPYMTLEDFIAAARKSPGKLANGTSGYGAVTHLAGVLLAIKSGIQMNHIPFTGGGPALTALMGKHVDCGFASVGTYGGHIRPGGKLRPLLVFADKRDANIPNVPTAKEKGFDIILTSWFGLNAPKNLPEKTKAVIVRAFKRTAEDVLVVDQLTKLGYNPAYVTPEDMGIRVQEEYKLFEGIWKEIGKKK